MFETEIKEIRNKLARSLRLWRKAERITNEVRNAKDTFYIHIYQDYKFELYEQAKNTINTLIACQIGNKFAGGWTRDKKEFDIFCLKAQDITKKDVLETLKENINNKYVKAPEVNKDTITISLKDYNLPLLLSSLNILINNDIETIETIDKARQALKDCNTFVYRGIKITIYKNGKTKLVFSDDKIKNIFVDKII